MYTQLGSCVYYNAWLTLGWLLLIRLGRERPWMLSTRPVYSRPGLKCEHGHGVPFTDIQKRLWRARL